MSWLDWTTVRTCRGLIMGELKRLKTEHKTCTDVDKRRKRVGRIEVLRAALSDLDQYARTDSESDAAQDSGGDR